VDTAAGGTVDAERDGQAGRGGQDGAGGSGTALVPVAGALVAGLLAATYLVARRRRAG
jgi:LPXTG-motif cell wall-anchored protein